MRLLLAGGGTGGHLFPAVALAEQLRSEEPQAEVLFVGTAQGLEARLLPQLGWPLQTIDMAGFVGRGLGRKLALLPVLARGIRQSLRILAQFRPDAVVGVGGYASVPILLAARLSGRPYLIHEQNAAAGLANRLLGRWAQRVCLSFAEAGNGFRRDRTLLTGNPLRRGMEQCPPLPQGELQLLVFGGSRGARAINQAVLAMLPELAGLRGQLKILHQTGEADCAEVQAGYQAVGWPQAEVVPFITDMAQAYARTQLVVCRAGATTLAELTACGRPAILIPYPHAAGDHQTINALALAQRGAALLLPQSELTGARLAPLVGDLLADRPRLESMAGASRSLGRHGAAARIIAECRSLVHAAQRSSN